LNTNTTQSKSDEKKIAIEREGDLRVRGGGGDVEKGAAILVTKREKLGELVGGERLEEGSIS